jgi:Tol biopolymer transport system component
VFNHPKGNEELHVYDFNTRQISAVPGSKGFWSSRWSPDGRYIAALSANGQELMLHDCQDKKWRSLGVRNVNEMTWSHDGQSIFLETDGENPALYKIQIKTRKPQRMFGLMGTATRGVMTGFTLAPDDSPIVLRELGTTEIYALKLDKQ